MARIASAYYSRINVMMYYTLVGGIGRLHIVNLPVNLFCQLAVRQGVDIIDCIFFLEVVLFAIIRAAFSC